MPPDEMPPDDAPTQVPEERKPRNPTGSSDVDRRRLLRVLAGFGWSVGVALCFGLVGLIWLLPPMRRRARDRAGRCGTCRRHGTVGRIALLGFLFLLCAGAGMRIYTAVTPQIICHSQIKPSGEIRPQPVPPAAEPAPPIWAATRRAVVAPISGVALLASRAAGMHECWDRPLMVTFWWPPRTGGGSDVGDTFVTWIPKSPIDPDTGLYPANPYAYGLGEESYERFGPNIHTDPDAEQRLAEHETRHLDQWTVFTLAGGPLAFPVSYYLDSAFFPDPRNHFERAAGLSDGGYPIPDSYGPDPIWWLVAVIGIASFITFRTRLRLLSRMLIGGQAQRHRSQPQRCPRHSTGWFRRI